jgi:protein-disulfide isomerase-like protein with CxxC motif
LAFEGYQYAKEYGKGNEYNHRVLEAFFVEGRDIRDIIVLTKLAGEVGLDEKEFEEALNRGMKTTDLSPDDWREWRRMRAVQLKQQGWYQRAIAEALDVSEVSISRWLTRACQGGSDALRAHPSPGRPCRYWKVPRR